LSRVYSLFASRDSQYLILSSFRPPSIAILAQCSKGHLLDRCHRLTQRTTLSHELVHQPLATFRIPHSQYQLSLKVIFVQE
jgi:hypothetical protein